MRKFAIAIPFLLALLAACASGPKLRIDRDPAANLSAYRTFGFFEQSTTDRARYTTILTTRLQQATRQQLEQRGYIYSDANPDLKVNFLLNVVDKQELRSTGGSFYRPYRGWYGSPVETVDYRKGTLSIDMVDAARNALVWQGVAEGRISEKTASEPGAAIEQVVREIFAGFSGR